MAKRKAKARTRKAVRKTRLRAKGATARHAKSRQRAAKSNARRRTSRPKASAGRTTARKAAPKARAEGDPSHILPATSAADERTRVLKHGDIGVVRSG